MKLPSLQATALAAVALFSSTILAIPASGRAWTVGQKVKTTGGILVGQEAQGASGVSEYLGIAYVVPPVGERRFKEPERYVSDREINAKNFGFACWQNQSPPISDDVKRKMEIGPQSDRMFVDLGRWPGTPGSMSEDCLTLNVWTKPQTGDQSKAVLVWFHGGSYNSGSSIYKTYNGKFLAEDQDVIVVSVNYRLNVFGFPGDPLSTPNLGLLDARLAMEWIRSNIASFGGDVSRITMFGQSAGAGLIDMYSFAFHADPIATGFGLLSGIAAGGTPPQRAVDTASAWFNLAGAVGCPKSLDNIAATHRCMMEKDPKALMAPLYTDNYVTDGGPTFYPTIDGITVFDNYNGRPSSPGGYLIGNTDYEAGLFLMYRPDWPDSTWRDLNDEYFTCPSARRSLQVARDKQKVWRYRYFGDFPNSRVTNNPPSGAWHGAELPLFFNTINQDLIPTTQEQKTVGKYMRNGLGAFAKNPLNGLTNFGWPEYSPLSNSLIRLGYGNSEGPNKAVGGLYDLSCNL